jgi:hypothetical protein
MAPDFGSSPRHIGRRISGYVPVNVTPVTGQKTSKMGNYFLPRPSVSVPALAMTNLAGWALALPTRQRWGIKKYRVRGASEAQVRSDYKCEKMKGVVCFGSITQISNRGEYVSQLLLTAGCELYICHKQFHGQCFRNGEIQNP